LLGNFRDRTNVVRVAKQSDAPQVNTRTGGLTRVSNGRSPAGLRPRWPASE